MAMSAKQAAIQNLRENVLKRHYGIDPASFNMPRFDELNLIGAVLQGKDPLMELQKAINPLGSSPLALDPNANLLKLK